MFFFNSRHTHRYPVSKIVSVGPYYGGDKEYRKNFSTVQMENGEQVIIYDDELDKFMPEKTYIGVLTAERGHSLVNVSFEEEPTWISRAPIIAWLASDLGDLTPVTARGAWDDAQPFQPIEYPDGRVYFGEQEAEFASVDDLVADLRATHLRRLQEAAAKAAAKE